MSATTSNLHDQFHAMLQNMRQAPLQPPPVQPQVPPPQTIVLTGGKPADTVSLSGGGQKDNISKFFKKHWGKILALCIIVVVVTVFVARYFITKRKKNKKLKEASEDQENIQWEQFFNVPAQGASPPPQLQLPQSQQQNPSRPAFPPLSEAQPHQPQQQPHHRPPHQQPQQPHQQQQPQQPHQQQQPQQPQQPHQQPQQPRPSQRVPPQVQQITAQLNNGPIIQSQAVGTPAAPVDPRIEAMGIRVPKKEPKDKENDLPKPDTDVSGKIVTPAAPKGTEIDDIVTG